MCANCHLYTNALIDDGNNDENKNNNRPKWNYEKNKKDEQKRKQLGNVRRHIHVVGNVNVTLSTMHNRAQNTHLLGNNNTEFYTPKM